MRLITDEARNNLRAQRWRKSMYYYLATGKIPVLFIPRRSYPKKKKQRPRELFVPLETLRRKRA